MYKVCYWDSEAGEQRERDATPEETAEIDARKAPNPAQLQADATAAIQTLLDSTAQAHGYDNIISLCTYVTSGNPTWAAEGQYGRDLRDACWSAAHELHALVLAGDWPTPGAGQLPTVADVLAAMPVISWPAM